MWGWLPFQNRGRRRRSPFNNLGPEGLTCGQVTEHLFVGGELGPNDWHALRHAGVSMVVNLQQEQQDVFTEDEQVDGYLWLPAPDGLAPTLGQLALGVDFIHAAGEGKRKVLVHCKAGQGRAPLLCACYLISRGTPLMDALIQVRQARPQTMLTPEQNVRLREFASAFASKVASQSKTKPQPKVKANSESQAHTQAIATVAPSTIVPPSVAAPHVPSSNKVPSDVVSPNGSVNGIAPEPAHGVEAPEATPQTEARPAEAQPLEVQPTESQPAETHQATQPAVVQSSPAVKGFPA